MSDTDSGHTPEPWEWVQEPFERGSVRYVALKAGEEYVLSPRFNHHGGTWLAVSDEDAPLIARAPDMAAELDRLRAVNAQMREALKKATHELNAIRARDGAPQHIDWHKGRPLQTSSVCENYFNELVEECFAALQAAEALDNG